MMQHVKESRFTIFLLIVLGLLVIYALRFSMKRCDCEEKAHNKIKKVETRQHFESERIQIENFLEEELLLRLEEDEDDLEPLDYAEMNSEENERNIKVLSAKEKIDGEKAIELEIFVRIPSLNIARKFNETFMQDLADEIEDFWDLELKILIETTVEKIENYLDGIRLTLIVENDEIRLKVLKHNFDGQEKLFERILKRFGDV